MRELRWAILACALAAASMAGCRTSAASSATPANVDRPRADAGVRDAAVEPPPGSIGVLAEQRYANGYLQFVNRIELPNTVFHLRGPMTVRLYREYVLVDRGGDNVHMIPRERVIYVGPEI